MIDEYKSREKAEDLEAMARITAGKREARRAAVERARKMLQKESELFTPLNKAMIQSEVILI